MKREIPPLTSAIAPAEGIRVQKALRGMVSRRWDGRRIESVAGIDVHFPSRKTARAAIVVLSFPELEPIESFAVECPCEMPYIPGLLSFREIPPILEAWKNLDSAPSIALCDSHGTAHPRGLGMASHLGLLLDIPTIGCAKSHLYGSFEDPGPSKGDRSPVRDRTGRIIGTVLRTRDNVRPVYVSIGHMIDLRRAVGITIACTPRYRIPSPLRAAHRLAGEYSA